VAVTTGGKVTANAKLHANVGANTVRKSLNSRSFTRSLQNTKTFHDPHARASITARAAMAGSHHGRAGRNGWWQHSNGGYGWVGPLFWPFAFYDMYDYALWGDDYDDSFWGYGYDDLYAGLFAPYSYDDLTGYLPESTVTSPTGTGQAPPASATPSQLTVMCGNDNRDIAGLAIDQFQQAIQPDDAQRAALDDLANASLKAAQDIKAACPADIALTAPARLAAMQTRIEAMIAAVASIQPPLEKFYGLLSDDQKAKLIALGEEKRKGQPAKPGDSLASKCAAAQSAATGWPTAEIEQAVHPTDAQHASLAALETATAKAADMLKASCLADNPLTPPARLAAAGKRLDTLLQAVKTVHSALGDFYGSLSDEQKAKFDAIGPQLTSETGQPTATNAAVRRHRHGGVGHAFRRFIRYF
jgi:hypothetical protein